MTNADFALSIVWRVEYIPLILVGWALLNAKLAPSRPEYCKRKQRTTTFRDEMVTLAQPWITARKERSLFVRLTVLQITKCLDMEKWTWTKRLRIAARIVLAGSCLAPTPLKLAWVPDASYSARSLQCVMHLHIFESHKKLAFYISMFEASLVFGSSTTVQSGKRS